nr:hypothetical protein [Tanacetum cinerariifolium]
MIIGVTSLKIMKYFGYSHLEENIVQRQNDQLYKFREGDFKIFCRQEIKDMFLLLVQDKLYTLNLEERPEVLDVPKYNSESDVKSWTFSQDEDDADKETNVNADNEETKFDNDRNDLTRLNLSTYKADDKEEEEKENDDEVSSD